MGDEMNKGGSCDSIEAKKKRPEQSCAFYELFSFADKWDHLLMTAGSLGAVAHGAAMPAFFLLFGELINGFGKNQFNLRKMTDEVSKVRKMRIMHSVRSYLQNCSVDFEEERLF